MGILAWLFLGLLAGALARFILPGKAPGGIIMTIVLGIIGAAVGGFIGSSLGWGTVNDFDFRSLGLAVLGGIVVLFIFGVVTKK